MQPNSQFAAAYSKGINKLNYWEPVMEDSLDIIAKLPAIAALIYTNVYKAGNTIQADSKLDWAANLSHMMGMRFAQYGPPLTIDCVQSPLLGASLLEVVYLLPKFRACALGVAGLTLMHARLVQDKPGEPGCQSSSKAHALNFGNRQTTSSRLAPGETHMQRLWH